MITELQKQLRRGKLGSSSAAAALGLDPYRSAADVFLELTGQAEDFAGNEATERGNLLEPVLTKWASDKLGKPFVTDRMYSHASDLLCWNADGANDLVAPSEALECKTTVDETGLGEEGTDEIKEQWLVQIAHAMAVVPTLRVVYVPVLLPGFKKFDFRMYKVERNQQLAEIVEAKGLQFMRENVLANVPPTDSKPSLEVLKRVRRIPSKTISLPDDATALYDQAKALREQKSAIEKQCKQADAAVLALLGDAEQGVLPDGRAVTYMSTNRAGYTVEPCTYRTLRFVKAAK